jgi:hypothetical protein
LDEGREEKAAESRTDGRQHDKRRELYEWPKRGWNSDETTTWRSGKQSRKEASNQQSSKQAVGVNEQSWREDEERLLSVAFTALNLNHLVNWKS